MLHSVVKHDVICPRFMHHIGAYIATDFLPLQLQQNKQEKAQHYCLSGQDFCCLIIPPVSQYQLRYQHLLYVPPVLLRLLCMCHVNSFMKHLVNQLTLTKSSGNEMYCAVSRTTPPQCGAYNLQSPVSNRYIRRRMRGEGMATRDYTGPDRPPG